MKKLLVLLGLFALPLFAAGAEVPEVLLTSAGELFSISPEVPSSESESLAVTHLVLTERTGGKEMRQVVPATKTRGRHSNPVLGFDGESGTLFVFWIQNFDAGFYSQLLLCTRDSAGTWSEPMEFGSPYNYPENLRVAVTRKVADAEGGSAYGLTVHATWWEFDTRTGRESTQYHMLSIENGRVIDNAELDLTQFVDHDVVGGEDIDQSVLKFPMLTTSFRQDSVLVTFGELKTRSFSQVRITPTLSMKGEVRIRIPIGKRGGGFTAPRMNVNAGSTLEGVFSESDTLALYTNVDSALRYAILKNGLWSEARTIALDEQITSSAAVNALRKMVAEE